MSGPYARLDAETIAPVAAPEELGPPPQLAWVEVAELWVDRRYQRDMTPRGRTRVARIAAAWDWRLYSAILVAPRLGGGYAVIDGQHRAQAARAIGIASLPALIVQADEQMQARAFDALNRQAVRVSAIQAHKAALAAGDAVALAVEAAAKAAGVEVLRYPIAHAAPHQTMAVGALRRIVTAYGPRRAERVLRLVMASDAGCSAGAILAVAGALAQRPRYVHDPRLEAAMAAISLDAVISRGSGAGNLVAALDARLGGRTGDAAAGADGGADERL